MDLDDFLLQELLARDEWYEKYLPVQLRQQLFDANHTVIFTHADDKLLQQITDYRAEVEKQWHKAESKSRQVRQQIQQTALPGLKDFLKLDLAESEIEQISGLDTNEIQILLYPAWDFSQKVYLTFTGVKESWMGKMHHADANWWLVDELLLNEERDGWYDLRVLFGNADYVGQLQISFQEVTVCIEADTEEL